MLESKIIISYYPLVREILWLLTFGLTVKNIKKKIVVCLVAVGMMFGLSVVTAAPAMAFSGGEMSQACRLADYGHDKGGAGWTAQLTYPNQGVYGWRCYYNNAQWAYWYNTKFSLDVQLLCTHIYGGSANFTSQSNANSWYCS